MLVTAGSTAQPLTPAHAERERGRLLWIALGKIVAALFAAAIGVGIGVIWAWRSGQAEDFYAWGLYVNGAYALGILVAVLVRWAPIGVLVELLRGRGMAWRTDPAMAGLRRRYVIASWLWVGVFAARLAVQVPLYLAGEVAALGVARLVMGLPLFALAAWLTWVLVREPASASPAVVDVEAHEVPPRGEVGGEGDPGPRLSAGPDAPGDR